MVQLSATSPMWKQSLISGRRLFLGSLTATTTTTTTRRSSSLAPELPSRYVSNDGVYKYFTNNEVQSSSNNSISSSSQSSTVYNPATGQAVATVTANTPDEVDTVIERAVAAFEDWKYVPPQQRQRVFFEYQHLLRQTSVRDALVDLIVLENGKTVADARGDVFRGLEVVETAAGVAGALRGDSLAGVSRQMDCVSYREPLGVCAGIGPFNFPVMIPLWMFPLAIASGNAMVYKPSEKTPGASLLLAELAAQAGLPPNLLQIVHGGGADTVPALCRHADIRAVSFVGGNAAGLAIHEQASAHGKRVQANLGAKNHAVVLTQDAGLDRANVVQALVGAAMGAAGQRCMALSVVVLVGTQTQEWVNDLAAAARQLTTGPGWQAGVDVGPLISPASRDRVVQIIEQASEDGGADLVLDGRGVVVEDCPDGFFVGPTVLQCSDTDNVCYTEEIFGPVLTVLTVETLEEAIALVNRNPYGNGCALFTSSGAAARRFQSEIQVTQVGINTPIPVPLPMFSFTGGKDSIRGDLNFYGQAGVQFYTQLKTVTSHWPDQPQTSLGGVTMPTMEQPQPNNKK